MVLMPTYSNSDNRETVRTVQFTRIYAAAAVTVSTVRD